MLHTAHIDVFMQSRVHACVLSPVLQCHAVWCISVTRCVAVCCTRRIATYSCNPTHAHAYYQGCSNVMQCDTLSCRSVIQCGGVCCTSYTAPYASNRVPYCMHRQHSTLCMQSHTRACVLSEATLSPLQPPRLPFLSIRVCLRLYVCAHVYVRLCACGCVGVGLGVCVREGEGGGVSRTS